MKVIAHLSDIHFGAHDARIVERLLAAVERARPDLVVVSGDLTQHARRAEFREAARFLGRLPAPVLTVPGNHDVPGAAVLERLRDPFGRYRAHIAPDLCPRRVDGELAVVGLNSARAFGWHWSWAHGRLSRGQLDLVEATMLGLPERVWKVVVTHHPFLPPVADPGRRVVGGVRRAVARFELCGIDLLLAGHFHRAYQADIRSLHTSIRRSILVVQAATATSTRLRGEPNAFNRLVLDGEQLTVQAWEWDGADFTAGGREDFLHRRHGWTRMGGNTSQPIKS